MDWRARVDAGIALVVENRIAHETFSWTLEPEMDDVAYFEMR